MLKTVVSLPDQGASAEHTAGSAAHPTALLTAALECRARPESLPVCRFTCTENKLAVTSGDRDRGGTIQGQGFKLPGVKKATRMYCSTWEIQPMFYDNSKWSITFKIVESLYCTPVTYIILYSNYTSTTTTKIPTLIQEERKSE